MIRRFLILVSIALFIAQLGFSVYYSGEIITQNSEFELNSTTFQQTNLTHQQLVYQLSLLTSINHLSEIAPPDLQPIRQTIDLSHE